MEKAKVTFNQLIAGALLKFGKIDSADMTLLMYGINDSLELVDNEFECLDEYFVMADGSIMLNNSYVEKINKNINNNLLERMQGNAVKEYLDNLDMNVFVLRKIKLLGLGCVPKDDIIHCFSVKQIHVIAELYNKGYIIDYWHEECIYDDYQAIKLTKRGELEIFLVDNQKEITKFSRLLKKHGYDILLIQSFLITQDLEKSPLDILTIQKFMAFCNEFDRCPYAQTQEIKGYSKKKATSKI